MARKTDRQRREERRVADLRVWERFTVEMESVSNRLEALKLVNSTPGVNQPGRHFYSNLAFFMEHLVPPSGADVTEKGQYIRLVQRMDVAGDLQEGVADRVISALRESIQRET